MTGKLSHPADLSSRLPLLRARVTLVSDAPGADPRCSLSLSRTSVLAREDPAPGARAKIAGEIRGWARTGGCGSDRARLRVYGGPRGLAHARVRPASNRRVAAAMVPAVHN